MRSAAESESIKRDFTGSLLHMYMIPPYLLMYRGGGVTPLYNKLLYINQCTGVRGEPQAQGRGGPAVSPGPMLVAEQPNRQADRAGWTDELSEGTHT